MESCNIHHSPQDIKVHQASGSSILPLYYFSENITADESSPRENYNNPLCVTKGGIYTRFTFGKYLKEE
jgi:hypothetical protein